MVHIYIYTESDNVKVHNGGTYVHSFEFSGSSGDWVYNHSFSPVLDGDMGKAMMIFQAGENYADYAKTLNNNTPIDFCNFKYPSGLNANQYSNGTVYINNETPFNSSHPQTYAAWDLLGHEYGHHVQNVFNLCNNPGGRHSIPSNNIDDQYTNNGGIYSLEQSKDRGHRLSWAEGWPTFWSTVAQSHFSTDLKTINTVGDTR